MNAVIGCSKSTNTVSQHPDMSRVTVGTVVGLFVGGLVGESVVGERVVSKHSIVISVFSGAVQSVACSGQIVTPGWKGAFKSSDALGLAP